MKTTLLALLAGLALLLAGLFFSGSLPGVLFGAKALNIDGVAEPHGAGLAVRETGWRHYGGDAGGSRYSPLDAINRENVRHLKSAWRYQTGDAERPLTVRQLSAAEGTPILVDDSLIFCTPFNEIIALDPGTGAEKWRYNSAISLDQRPANQFVCRGVAYWEGAGEGECASRIFMGTNDGRLIAVDAKSGRLCSGFADAGMVTVDPGMALVWPGEFQITSPPVVINDTVVVGSAISDNVRVRAPSGAVRAFDARSGASKWIFDPIPRAESDENAGDWRGDRPAIEGHANVWAPISVDEQRGLIFLPTSSPSPDFFGGLRPGDNRYANSVVALNAETGAVVWSFQTVHHDVWDYDLPAQPGLYTVWRDGVAHDVVAQATKTGHVFVLDRDSGKPFLPVDERAVPQEGAIGEALSPTQPFPVTPGIVPDRVDPRDAFGLTGIDRRACRKILEGLRADGLYTPPSLEGTLLRPANLGGANWGGTAFDEARNLLVVNMSNVAHAIRLIPADDVGEAREIFHDSEIGPQAGAPFGVKRDVVLSPIGLPCTPPPWGVIAGVDLASGEIVWRKRFGTTKDIANGVALELGTPNVGGPVVTAGGLVFIGAGMDNYLRAFDVETGEALWKGRLPAGGQATPMTYEWKGRQYVVIYAGGHARIGTTLGDSLIAFALPE
ncbi:MAG: pyrroloquinoline quinone-dependent dehydrogenase [Pseudomonadota bacterium]